jgi:hypothetical protein
MSPAASITSESQPTHRLRFIAHFLGSEVPAGSFGVAEPAKKWLENGKISGVSAQASL